MTEITTKIRCKAITHAGEQCKMNAKPGTEYCGWHPPSGILEVREGGKPQCTKIIKRTGKRCMRRAVATYPVCQKHGAGSPFKGRPGGRPPTVFTSSDKLPRDLARRVRKAVEDPEILNLSENIGVLKARAGQLLEELPEEDEQIVAFNELQASVKAMEKAMSGDDPASMVASMQRLKNAMDPIKAEREQWKEIMTVLQQHGRLVTKETDRRVKMGAILRAEEGMAMIKVLIDIVNKNVPEQSVRNIIAAEFARYFTQ